MSRGFDLNNPMDLEINPHFRWNGEIRPTADPVKVLCQFVNVVDGLRAGALDLYNQQALHGLMTWREIITKYAPPSENDTEAYLAKVCDFTGVGPDDRIYLADPSFLAKAVAAVIIQEQGTNPYVSGQIEMAIRTFIQPKTGDVT